MPAWLASDVISCPWDE